MSDSPKTVTVKISVFLKMWETLVELAKRALSSPEHETDVALCLAAYEPQAEKIGDVQTKVRKQHILGQGKHKARIVDRLGMDEKLLRIGEMPITIRLPEKLLTKAHLPQVSDDEGDLKNRAANAAICKALGPIFDWGLSNSQKTFMSPVEQDGLGELDAILAIEPDKSAGESEEDVAVVSGNKSDPGPIPPSMRNTE